MSEIHIKAELLPKRCEICHQSDCFDPQNNYCSRCASFNVELLDNTLTARLVKKGWLFRTFELTTREGVYTVTYDGRGMGYESVIVQDKVMNASSPWFVPEFKFLVGTRSAVIKVKVWPWMAIRKFTLEIDGKLLYAE